MGRQDRILLSGSSLYVSQIIDNLHDLAPYLGADTETIVNHIQRHCHSPRRQWERLTVRAMLRQALGPEAAITYEESGRPMLKSQISTAKQSRELAFAVGEAGANLAGKFESEAGAAGVSLSRRRVTEPQACHSNPQYLSISHSKTHAALLLSSHKDIGVDIEQVSPRILRLADRLAQPIELPTDFAALSPEQQARYLTTLWTVKEAVYKSLDSQLGIDMLRDIVATPQPPGTFPTEITATVKGQAAPRTVHVMDYHGDILAATV